MIENNWNCCGCSACIHICPKQCVHFYEDNEGFLYPKIDTSHCIDCGLCGMVCPVINQSTERQPLKVYAAKHPDDEIRMKSSSGGIFTLLAEQVIDEGGVVFGARFNDNWEVIHDYTETKEGLSPFRGSKYVQSYMGGAFNQVKTFLEFGRKVMFSGTPCQIAGLKRYLRHEYPNLLTVDFVCHGVPSPKVWRLYLQEEIARQGERGKNTVLTSPKDMPVITGINFRDKSTGWKKYSFVLNFSKASAEGEQNSVLSSIHTENLYMATFLANLSIRESCYSCKVKAGRSGSDITIGDYWGIDRLKPNMCDGKGCGLVLVNTIAGAELFDLMHKEAVETSYGAAIGGNPSILGSVEKPINRSYFFSCIANDISLEKAYVKSTKTTVFYRLRRLVYRILHNII